jgi:hypothetical protein
VLAFAAAFAIVPLWAAAPSALAGGDVNVPSCPSGTEASPGFRTYLPDCRAYEMVSPPYKQGYPVNIEAIAPDGSSLMGWSWGVFAGATGVPQQRRSTGTQYEFTREGTGWASLPLAPPSTLFSASSTWLTTSADASTSLWSMPTAPVGQDDFYIRQADGSFVDVGPATPPADGPTDPPAPEGSSGPRLSNFPFQGASSDLSHILFDIDASEHGFTWPGDATVQGRTNLYEYAGTGNSRPTMVGVSGGAGSTTLIGQCGVDAGGPHSTYNAISADGSVVFFTPIGADEGACGGIQPPIDELFARIGQSRTVMLSSPSPAECATSACQSAPASDALFEGASRDGSKVFFASTQQLTDQAAEDPASADSAVTRGCPEAHGNGCNLYEYDFANPAGRNLLAVSAGSPSPHVQGVVRISQDGSHVYFVAHGVLTNAPNSQRQTAQAGMNNLYVFERDAQVPAGHTAFIATVAPEDEELWGERSNSDINRPAQATPDGRFLVFRSHAALTPDDTSSGVWQVFEYDAQTGGLVRVSSGQDGFNNNGNTNVDNATIPPQFFGNGDAGDQPQQLALSEDGSYVVFESADGLTPQALNNVVIDSQGDKAHNVYEYHDGNVFLISDGHDVSVAGNGTGSNVSLLGISQSGADIYFKTASQLVPQDVDTQQDIYDARMGGGFALSASPAECVGEACQGTLAATPFAPVPGSASQLGGDNLTPAPPPKAGKPKTAAEITAEKLSKALKACRAKRNKKQRAACEDKARKRYRSKSKASSKTNRTGGSK